MRGPVRKSVQARRAPFTESLAVHEGQMIVDLTQVFYDGYAGRALQESIRAAG
jgi:hypothetical protein